MSSQTNDFIRISQPNLQESDFELVLKVLRSGMLVTGEVGKQVENYFTALLQSKQSVNKPSSLISNTTIYTSLVSSGTAALHLALVSLNIGPGDLVFVPNYTFPATVNVVKLVGATPILVDVDPQSYVLTVESLAKAFEDAEIADLGHPKAVIPVHEFGYPVNMEALMKFAKKHELFVIEDAACAIGAQYNDTAVGTWGDVGCFSLHPRKIVTSGEGGIVVTRDAMLYHKINRLKSHGIERNQQGQVHFVEPGFNYRLTDIQAALILPQLQQLEQWIEKRRLLAQYYHENLEYLVKRGYLTLPTSDVGHSWQSYVVCLAPQFSQVQVSQKLRKLGVETNCGATVLSTIPYLQSALSPRIIKGAAHHTLLDHTLALPLCETYQESMIQRVSKCLDDTLSKFG